MRRHPTLIVNHELQDYKPDSVFNSDPTHGSVSFRGDSRQSNSNASVGGKAIEVSSGDTPGFSGFNVVHTNGHTWASTQGGYDFTELIAGFSYSFKHALYVVAKANWAVRFVGNRNGSGQWVNNGSSVTWQGGSTKPVNFSTTVTSGALQLGTAAGLQILGLGYANHHIAHYE